MNKTKKFLHMIISFAFAFVLAIGGIGIKSAKASVTTDDEEYEISDYVNAVIEVWERLNLGPNNVCLLIESSFLQNFQDGNTIDDIVGDPFIQSLIDAVALEKNFTANTSTARADFVMHKVIVFVFNTESTAFTNITKTGANVYHGIGDYSEFRSATGYTSQNSRFQSMVPWEINAQFYSYLSVAQRELGDSLYSLSTHVWCANENGELTPNEVDGPGTLWVSVYNGANPEWITDHRV